MGREEEEEQEEEESSSASEEEKPDEKTVRRQYWFILFCLGTIVQIMFYAMMLFFNERLIKDDANNATSDETEHMFHLFEFSLPIPEALLLILVTIQMPRDFKASRFWLWLGEWVQFISLHLQLATAILGALLIYVGGEEWEITAHYIDYSSFVCQCLFDLSVIFLSRGLWWKKALSFVMIIISLGCIISMFILISQGQDFTTHKIEFSMEILLSLATILTISIKRR